MLVAHHWGLQFCSRQHKEAFLKEQPERRDHLRRWLSYLEAVSKPRNGHFRWFSGDDQTRKTGHCVIAERPSKRLVNTPAMSFETDS